MQRILFGLLAALVAVSISAQEPGAAEAPPTYQQQLDRFFAHVEAGEYREAIDDYFATNPWMEQLPDQLSSLKAQFSSLPDLAGEPHGWDLVVEQHFADSFVYLHYIVEYDRTPISFHFTFYRPADAWRAYSFEYKEDLKDLAAELAKLKLTFPHLADPDAAAAPRARKAGRAAATGLAGGGARMPAGGTE